MEHKIRLESLSSRRSTHHSTHITENGQVEYREPGGRVENVSADRIKSLVQTIRSQDDVPVILEVEGEALAGVMVRVMDAAYQGDPGVKITVQNID